MEVIIKDKALTTVLEEIWEAFCTIDPDGAEAFVQYVETESQTLLKPSGMSVDGALLNFMKIPCIKNSIGNKINLYGFIKQCVRDRCGIPDFFNDRENYNLLCRTWRAAKVRRKPTPFLDVGATSQ